MNYKTEETTITTPIHIFDSMEAKIKEQNSLLHKLANEDCVRLVTLHRPWGHQTNFQIYGAVRQHEVPLEGRCEVITKAQYVELIDETLNSKSKQCEELETDIKCYKEQVENLSDKISEGIKSTKVLRDRLEHVGLIKFYAVIVTIVSVIQYLN